MESFKYCFASKNGRTLCIKYSEKWELSQFEYLNDKGYTLTPASESHWNRQIDEVGRLVECYLLDNDLQEFNVGTF